METKELMARTLTQQLRARRVAHTVKRSDGSITVIMANKGIALRFGHVNVAVAQRGKVHAIGYHPTTVIRILDTLSI